MISGQICAIPKSTALHSWQCQKLSHSVLHSPTNTNLGRELALTGFHQRWGAIYQARRRVLNPSRKLVSPLDGDRQFSIYDDTANDESGTASRSSYACDYTSSYVSSLQTRIGIVVEEI
jgi:hypothetical protein